MGNTESTDIENFPDWMGKLPKELHGEPLTNLAIPGSHNSFAYKLDSSAPTSPDVNGTIKAACLIPGVKGIIKNWSVTQKLDLTQQLNAGIRYFDLRVSVCSKGPNTSNEELHLIHGLYGPRFSDAMNEINFFLEEYSNEVVVLDFNHFYQMNCEHHKQGINILSEIFASKLCPYQKDLCQRGQLTLDFMWKNGFQVIVFYHQDNASETILWPGNLIPSMWPNSSTLSEFKIKLEYFFLSRTCSSSDEAETYNKTFHVYQGVLSPVASQIITKFASSLEVQCAQQIAAYFVEWIQSKSAGKNGVNICIMDFVEMKNYIKTVIELNYKLVNSK